MTWYTKNGFNSNPSRSLHSEDIAAPRFFVVVVGV